MKSSLDKLITPSIRRVNSGDFSEGQSNVVPLFGQNFMVLLSDGMRDAAMAVLGRYFQNTKFDETEETLPDIMSGEWFPMSSLDRYVFSPDEPTSDDHELVVALAVWAGLFDTRTVDAGTEFRCTVT